MDFSIDADQSDYYTNGRYCDSEVCSGEYWIDDDIVSLEAPLFCEEGGHHLAFRWFSRRPLLSCPEEFSKCKTSMSNYSEVYFDVEFEDDHVVPHSCENY
jgi:hypothetical protein